MKTRRTKKQTTRIQRAGFALLASCILLSSCGQSAKNAQSSPQDLTQDTQKPTAVPEETESPVLTSTPEPTLTPEQTPSSTPAPEPTPTNTPIPTPTAIPEPTPMPDYTFLPPLYPTTPDKTSLLDYLTQEEIDTAFSLSYDHYNQQMQLYARYQGELQALKDSYGYCIDIIQVSAAMDILINIKIYSGSVRYVKYGDSEILQNMYYYDAYSPQLDAAKEVLQIMDINNDGYDDFIFDLGFSGNKNKYSLAFVYDVENAAYILLGSFLTATYMPEHQTIYEESYGSMGDQSHAYKYFIDGTQTILTEVIDYLPGECESYTYQKLIDGELVTLLEGGTYKELCEFIGDFETWEEMPATLE